MPMNIPPTMEEREAELAALQSAFDEYIASSRELEEELDAELAKMRKFLGMNGKRLGERVIFRVGRKC